MKKILLTMLAMLSLICAGCKNNNKPVDKEEPIFPNEKTDTVYMRVNTGDVTYNISKESMYINLRNTVGLSTLVEWADNEIITTLGKKGLYEELTSSKYEDLDDKPYIEQVTDEEIEKRVEEEKYPLGKENYSQEELSALNNSFNNNFYAYGYRSQEEINGYFRRVIAKEKLAKDYQILYHEGLDFIDGLYQTHYKNNYFNSYYMIFVPFDTNLSCNSTFKELNIEADNSDKNNVKLVKADTKEPLTVNEVIEAFIKLYNNSSLFKENVKENVTLTNGVDYKIVDGKYEFILNENSPLYYPKELSKGINDSLYIYINAYMRPYNKDTSNVLENNWFTINSGNFGDKYYAILLLGNEKAKSYEESKPEIKEALMKAEFDEEYIENVMSQMRTKMGLVVYDRIIQTAYINNFMPGSISDAEMENGYIVAAFNNKTLVEEDYFNLMDKRFGPYIAGELVNYYNVLYNKEINNVYDFTKPGLEKDRILNESLWLTVLDDVAYEKNDFEKGFYTSLGFPSGYGFENFLIAIYDVRTEKELAFHYLRRNLLFNYLTKAYSLANYDENSLYWKNFEKYMNQYASEYFNASGFEFTLTYLDETGNPSNPKDWSSEQVKMVEEFYGLIVEYLDNNANNYKSAIDLLELKYSDAQYLIGEKNSGELFEGMDLAKYKTAGINLIYEEFQNVRKGDLNDQLESAVKEMWDSVISSNDNTPKVYGKSEDGYKYIKANSGYQVYFTTNNTDLIRYEGRSVPNLEEIKEYIRNNDTTELTDNQKIMVANYYEVIYTDLIGVYNTAKMLYQQQANCEVTFVNNNNFTHGEYVKNLAITIDETVAKVIHNVQ